MMEPTKHLQGLSPEIHDAIARHLIRLAIESVEQAVQWRSPDSTGLRANRMGEAEAFVEAAEIISCGSTGGHDVGQPPPASVIDQLAWLIRKYQVDHGPTFKVCVERAWPTYGSALT